MALLIEALLNSTLLSIALLINEKLLNPKSESLFTQQLLRLL